MRAKKGECSKTHWNKNKKWKLFFGEKKDREKKQTCKNK